MPQYLKKILTGAVLYIILVIFFVVLKPIWTSIALTLILGLILLFEWPKLFNIKRPTFWLLMPFYPILPFLLMIYMSSIEQYRILLYYMILISYSQDLGGYAFGKIIGKRKLAPAISPKKTWEGFWGGIIITFLVLHLLLFLCQSKMAFFPSVLFSLSISILATVGDLFESLLKRRVGIKDSGWILPGHGGLLDRFDSLMFVAPLFFLLRYYLIKLFNIVG